MFFNYVFYQESEKKKEKKPEEECDSFAMLDLSGNYIIDGETGMLEHNAINKERERRAFCFVII